MASSEHKTALDEREIPWLVTPAKAQEAVRRIVEACHPHAVILFGSYARGEITRDSDLDILVVADDSTEHCRKEAVRLRHLLREVFMPMDILVVRQSDLERLKDAPGLIYQTCLSEGIVAYGKI